MSDTQKYLRIETLIRWQEAIAGKVVPHEDVMEWLESWGSEQELPVPKSSKE